MHRLAVGLLLMGACGGPALPVEHAPARRERPNWTAHLGLHVDAMRACLEGREVPRFVAFVEPLASGAAGISTVDAYGSVEHCAYFEGRVVRREPAPLSATDISQSHGALFSLGPVQPIVPVGIVLEEVLHEGTTLGWLYWPPKEGVNEEL